MTGSAKEAGMCVGVFKAIHKYSLPLLLGVVLAMVMANAGHDVEEFYHTMFHSQWGHLEFMGHPINFHFLINDIFMAFFFGTAAMEITEACLPGGSLNPPKKAANPLFATLGGVAGPVAVYVLLGGMLGFGAPSSEGSLHVEPGHSVITKICRGKLRSMTQIFNFRSQWPL